MSGRVITPPTKFFIKKNFFLPVKNKPKGEEEIIIMIMIKTRYLNDL